MSTRASALSKIEDPAATAQSEFACDVRAGLSKPIQKELHSKYLYDELGSALFDAITLLPEYGLTRADARLLQSRAPEIAAALPGPVRVVELGSGNGSKTRQVLQAIRTLQPHVTYHPIDVSAAALARCERELADVAQVQPSLNSYLDGMAEVGRYRQAGETLLILFLGSTLGNFERRCARAFLNDLRRHIQSGDALLVGVDLVKERERMLEAYDDPTGVTAAFNLNLLGRVNRELRGNFKLRSFQHVALYNDRERRIEMHLRAITAQTVSVPAAHCAVRLREGETIWTESSHKFLAAELPALAESAGFRVHTQWIDQEWPFAESLWFACQPPEARD